MKKEKKILNAWEDNIDVVAVGRIVFKNEHHVDKGDELWVRCPFHKEGKETNRSLWIGGKKNIWYCFGCQKGGGPIFLASWGQKIPLEEGKQWISERFTQSQVLTSDPC